MRQSLPSVVSQLFLNATDLLIFFFDLMQDLLIFSTQHVHHLFVFFSLLFSLNLKTLGLSFNFGVFILQSS